MFEIKLHTRRKRCTFLIHVNEVKLHLINNAVGLTLTLPVFVKKNLCPLQQTVEI